MPKFIDLTGHRFGRVLVLERAPNRGHRTMWRCACDCGTVWETMSQTLVAGETKSCGCAQPEAVTKHGMHGTPTYSSWQSMLARCHRPAAQGYDNYGGRGIFVCERWRKSFANFRADMGARPDGMSIERIDNERGYEPGNCKWATDLEQHRNTRRSLRLTNDQIQEIHGRCEHGESQKSVADRMGISQMSVSRVRRGASPYEQEGT